MAVDAVLSVLQGGAVVVKVIALDNGAQSGPLMQEIRTKKIADAQQIFEVAKTLRLGFDDGLVVMDSANVYHNLPTDPGDIYRATFSNSTHNPSSKTGRAIFTATVPI